jgi:hypothetical protein
MKRIFRRGIAAFIAAFALFALVIPGVSAQNNNQVANGFRISPVRSELTIDKGKSETITLTLENPSAAATTARAVINDFVASDKEDGEPRLILDETTPPPKNDFKKLVQPIADVPLGPREKKDIPVRISVPETANAGGYYGAIRFVPSGTVSSQQNVGLTASVGTIVLIRVPGNLVERLDLIQLSAGQSDKPRSFFTGGDVQVITRVKNEGDIHVKPFGKVQVKDMFGKVVTEFELNNTDPRSNVLPDSIRKFTDNLPKRRWLGRYTIMANLGYTQGSGDLITAQASFWYMPWWSLAVLALLVVALIGGGYWLYRKYGAPKQTHGKK